MNKLYIWNIILTIALIFMALVIIFLLFKPVILPDNQVISPKELPRPTLPMVANYTYTVKDIPTDVSITNLTMGEDFSGRRYISGTLKNNGTTPFSMVKINFGLYDINGSGMMMLTDIEEGLEPGAEREFQAYYMRNEVVTYKLLSVDTES